MKELDMTPLVLSEHQVSLLLMSIEIELFLLSMERELGMRQGTLKRPQIDLDEEFP